MQNWSKCVDEHREGSKDFTEECKDAVRSFVLYCDGCKLCK